MKIATKSVLQLSLALFAATLFSCSDDAPKVIGLNNTAAYGSIKISLSGIRSDDEPLSVTSVFRFMPEEGAGYSSYQTDGNYYFTVQRMEGAVNAGEDHNNNFALLSLESDDESVVIANMELNTYLLFSDNFSMYLGENLILSAEDITSYSFNVETGKLKLSFTTVLDSESNATNHELTLTGEINVTVFQGLNSPPLG